jgi:hypothetical protein
MKKIIVVIFGILMLMASGCTDNVRSKTFGGTWKQEIPKGQKVINVTWKNNGLWVLTRPMKDNETPEISVFKEYSNFGVMEGTVILVESK